MKIFKIATFLGLLLLTADVFGQYLPPVYQPMLNEIVTNFETIRGKNSITKGKNTLSVITPDKIALRIEHKKQVKNLTFITQPDEENNLNWVAANELTIDMVNKYEADLTKILESMLKLSAKESRK